MNSAKQRLIPIANATICILALVMTVDGQSPVAKTPNPDLVKELSQQLNITPNQATGGVGAIFQLVKSRLNPGDFTKLAGAVPGMKGFLKAAPTAEGGSEVNSLASSLGSLGGEAGSLGSLASLAGSFHSLGLSPSMAGKFVPVLEKYIAGKGGSGLAGLFSGALK